MSDALLRNSSDESVRQVLARTHQIDLKARDILSQCLKAPSLDLSSLCVAYVDLQDALRKNSWPELLVATVKNDVETERSHAYKCLELLSQKKKQSSGDVEATEEEAEELEEGGFVRIGPKVIDPDESLVVQGFLDYVQDTVACALVLFLLDGEHCIRVEKAASAAGRESRDPRDFPRDDLRLILQDSLEESGAKGGRIYKTLLARRRECRRWNRVEAMSSRLQDAPAIQRKNGEWAKARVFISSTFADTFSEREILVKRVFRHLREEFRGNNLQVYECDLRWGVPEGTPTAQTVSICLEELVYCAKENVFPFFVAIMGERYGWIPEAETLPEALRQRHGWVTDFSITAMEIIAGAYRPGSPNAFYFLRNSGFLDDPFFRQEVSIEETQGFVDLSGGGGDGAAKWRFDAGAAGGGLLHKAVGKLRELMKQQGLSGSPSGAQRTFSSPKISSALSSKGSSSLSSAVNTPKAPRRDEDSWTRVTMAKQRILRKFQPGDKQIIDGYNCRYAGRDYQGKILLDGLDSFADQVKERLSWAFSRQYPAMDDKQLSLFDLNEIILTNFVEGKAQEFVGREQLIQRIVYTFAGRLPSVEVKPAHDTARDVVGSSSSSLSIASPVKRRRKSSLGSGMPPSVLLVTGVAGCGKSSLVATAVRRARVFSFGSVKEKARERIAVFAHFVGVGPRSTSFHWCLQRMINFVIETSGLQEDSEEIINDSSKSLGKVKYLSGQFLRYLSKAIEKNPLTRFAFVLDGVDQFEDADSFLSLDFVPSSHDVSPLNAWIGNVCFLLSCLPGKELESLRSSLGVSKRRETVTPVLEGTGTVATQRRRKTILQSMDLVKEIHVGALEKGDKVDIIDKILFQNFKKRLSPSQLVALLRKEGSENPLWLVTACEELRVFGLFPLMNQKIESIKPTVGELLEQVLGRLENEHTLGLVRDCLSLMTCSRLGLWEEELREMLGTERDPLPAPVWLPLLHDLSFCLRPPSQTVESALDFFHKELRWVVRKRYLSVYLEGMPAEKKYHIWLANYFKMKAMRSSVVSSSTLSKASPTPLYGGLKRAIAELSYHQRCAEVQLDVLVATIVSSVGGAVNSSDSTLRVSGNQVQLRDPQNLKTESFMLDFAFVSDASQSGKFVEGASRDASKCNIEDTTAADSDGLEEVDVTSDGTSDSSIGACLVSQGIVFDMIGSDVLDHVLHGMTVAVFCHGQAGTGKTHTMFGGKDEEMGLIPRVLMGLFEKKRGLAREGVEVIIKASAVQVHLDQAVVVFGTTGKNATNKKTKILSTSTIASYEPLPLGSFRDALVAVDKTKSENQKQSLVHVIFTVFVTCKETDSSKAKEGRIHFVDLAGYNRGQVASGADISKEMVDLNNTLALLHRCLAVRSKTRGKAKAVLMRDSPVMWLMRDTFADAAKTRAILLTTLSPEPGDHRHSLSTLRFAGTLKKSVPLVYWRDQRVDGFAEKQLMVERLLASREGQIKKLKDKRVAVTRVVHGVLQDLQLISLLKDLQEARARLKKISRSAITDILTAPAPLPTGFDQIISFVAFSKRLGPLDRSALAKSHKVNLAAEAASITILEATEARRGHPRAVSLENPLFASPSSDTLSRSRSTDEASYGSQRWSLGSSADDPERNDDRESVTSSKSVGSNQQQPAATTSAFLRMPIFGGATSFGVQGQAASTPSSSVLLQNRKARAGRPAALPSLSSGNGVDLALNESMIMAMQSLDSSNSLGIAPFGKKRPSPSHIRVESITATEGVQDSSPMRASALPPVSRSRTGKKGLQPNVSGRSKTPTGARRPISHQSTNLSTPGGRCKSSNNLCRVTEDLAEFSRLVIRVTLVCADLAKAVEGTLSQREVAVIFDAALLPLLAAVMPLLSSDNPSRRRTRIVSSPASSVRPSVLQTRSRKGGLRMKESFLSSHSKFDMVEEEGMSELLQHNSIVEATQQQPITLRMNMGPVQIEEASTRALSLLALISEGVAVAQVDLSCSGLSGLALDFVVEGLLRNGGVLQTLKTLRLDGNNLAVDSIFAVFALLSAQPRIYLGAPIASLFNSPDPRKKAGGSSEMWEEEQGGSDAIIPDQLVRGISWKYVCEQKEDEKMAKVFDDALREIGTQSPLLESYAAVVSRFLQDAHLTSEPPSPIRRSGEMPMYRRRSSASIVALQRAPDIASLSSSAKFFAHLCCLTEVDLTGFSLSSAAVDTICAMFRLPAVCKHVQVLRMRNVGADDSSLFSLQSILHHSSALEYWDLRDNCLSELSANALLQKIKEKGRRSLRHIDLDGNKCLTAPIKIALYRLFLSRSPTELHPAMERAVLEVFPLLRPLFEQRQTSGYLRNISYTIESLDIEDLDDDEIVMDGNGDVFALDDSLALDVSTAHRRYDMHCERHMHLGVVLRDLLEKTDVRSFSLHGKVTLLGLPLVLDLLGTAMKTTETVELAASFEEPWIGPLCAYRCRRSDWPHPPLLKDQEDAATALTLVSDALVRVAGIEQQLVNEIVDTVPLCFSSLTLPCLRGKCTSFSLHLEEDDGAGDVNGLMVWSLGFLIMSSVHIYGLDVVDNEALNEKLEAVIGSSLQSLRLVWSEAPKNSREERVADPDEGIALLSDNRTWVPEDGFTALSQSLPGLLSRSSSLTCLSLSHCPAALGLEFWIMLKKLPHLQQAVFRHCSALSFEAVSLSSDEWQGSLIPSQLTHLTIDHCGIVPTFSSLIDLLVTSRENCSLSILSLSLKNALKGINDSNTLKRSVQTFLSTMESIDLADNPIDGDILRLLARHSRSLRALSLSGCRVLPERNVPFGKSIVKCCVGLEDVLRMETVEEVWLDGASFCQEAALWTTTIFGVLRENPNLTIVANDITRPPLAIKLARDYPDLVDRVASVGQVLEATEAADEEMSSFLWEATL